jgi:hypothetical protein
MQACLPFLSFMSFLLPLACGLAEVLDTGAAVDGGGAGLDDHGSGLPAPVPEYPTAVSRCDVVLSLAEEAVLHASVPHAPVLRLVRRVEGARQLGQPAEAAEQLEEGAASRGRCS